MVSKIQPNGMTAATTTAQGAIRSSTNAEAQALTLTNVALSPGNMAALKASQAQIDAATANLWMDAAQFSASKFSTLGKQTYVMQAGSFAAHPTTGPTAAVTAESNGQIYRTLSFPDGSTTSAGVAIPLPKKVDVTVAFTVRIRFRAPALGNVRWQVAYSTNGDGEAINVAPTTQLLTAANGVIDTTEVTSQITCAWPASTAKEDTLYLTVSRIGGDASDTLTAAALLINVEISFTTDKGTDI